MGEQVSEVMWIVDSYCDRIKHRPKKQVLRDAESQFYQAHVKNRFSTYAEALQFCIERAEGCVKALEKDVQKARDRVKRLKRKYEGVA